MLSRLIGVFTVLAGLVQVAYCQTPQQPSSSTDSVSIFDRPVSWRTLVPNILQDQKQIYWDFPTHLAHGKHWVPTVVIAAAAGGLIAADQFDAPYFRRTSTYSGFNRAFSGTNTSLAIFLAPLSIYGAGLLTKNSYAEHTALLAGEAVADSEILDEVLKLSTRRARAESLPPNGNFADTWMDSRAIADGGFPSGHTIAAFSVATVISERYGRRHRWVPFVAYGLAATAGFSRMTLSAHFPSDVFVGAALGYAISRFAVLHSSQNRRDGV